MLNADKTKILVLPNNRNKQYQIIYCGEQINIDTLKEIKICGIWYCNDEARAYKLNITDKILKLESNLRAWRSRNLTYEGKSLIIKTFGLPQLIYGMQVLEIKYKCMKRVEQIMFGHIWLGGRSKKERGVDRIKRAVLKNSYNEGGLNLKDVESLKCFGVKKYLSH